MQKAPAVAGLLGQLAHQRQDRVADGLGLAPEPVEIERSRVGGDRGGGFGDRLGGVGGHDAEPRLGAGQRRLDLGAAREKRQLAERRAHRGGAEHVAEQGGGQDAEGHSYRAWLIGVAAARHPERLQSMCDQFISIEPSRIIRFDQADFPSPTPFLNVIFAGNRRHQVVVALKPYESIDTITRRKAVGEPLLMLINPPHDVAGDTKIQRAIFSIGKEIDVVGQLHFSCHSGAAQRAEPGIQKRKGRRCDWIPGSPLRGAPE